MSSSTRRILVASGVCVMLMAVCIVSALTLAGPNGIKVTISNESVGAIQVELWKHKDAVFLGTIEGNHSATCTFIPPGEPLVVRILDSKNTSFQKNLDVYYETGYTGSIRVFFGDGEITYECDLDMPGPSFGPRSKPKRRS